MKKIILKKKKKRGKKQFLKEKQENVCLEQALDLAKEFLLILLIQWHCDYVHLIIDESKMQRD